MNVNVPQSFNRYSYTINDPVNGSDPSGLRPQMCGLFTVGWDGGPLNGLVCFGTNPLFEPYVPREREPQNPQAALDWGKLKDCIQTMFPGVSYDSARIDRQDAFFNGTWQGFFSVSTIRVESRMHTFTSRELGERFNNGNPAWGAGGNPSWITQSSEGYVAYNYIASDLRRNGPEGLLKATWVHELGNSLASITGYTYQANDQTVHQDKDTGAAFEECVYGGSVYADGTLTPSTNPGYTRTN
jgi:hypothetical protein